jgi:hypothetical protein
MFGFKRPQAVEPPPEQYATGPTQTGQTTQQDWPLDQVMYLCRLITGGLPENASSSAYYQGCYNPRTDTVIVPEQGAWPSEDERQQLIAHEWAHARGWRHNPDGRGTSPQSLPPRGLIGSQYPSQGAAIGNR